MSNPKYEEYKAKHPDWSDEQIWTAISLDMEADVVIENKGNDVDPDDPDVIKEILVGARNWLSEVLPQIFERVKNFFDKIINTLGSWVQKGLQYVVDLIGTLLGK